MLKELMYKWFGLEPTQCNTCEVLRSELENSNRERRELLSRLLDRDQPKAEKEDKEKYKPIQPQFVPWRVRQQMLEAEDRKRAELLKASISKLEDELDVNASQERKTV